MVAIGGRELMWALGYPANAAGMCHGFALAALKAIITGRFDRYKKLNDLIESYNDIKKLVADVKAAEKRRKDFNSNPGDHETLTDKEKLLCDICPLCEEVLVFYNDNRMTGHLYQKIPQWQGDTSVVEQLVYPLNCKRPHEYQALSAIQFYDVKRLNSHLARLTEIWDNNPFNSHTSAIILKSYDHIITLYRFNNEWALISSRQIFFYKEIDLLAKGVIEVFSGNEKTLLVLLEIIYSLEDLGKEKIFQDLTATEILTPSNGAIPIFIACYDGQKDAVDRLLKNGAAVNVIGKGGATPLQCAAEIGHAGIVTELLAYGAEVDTVNSWGNAALHFAARYGHTGVATLLLKSSNVDLPKESGATALHVAACHNHAELVVELLAHGADVNNTDNHGWTALHCAAQYGHQAVVTLLLKRSKVNATNESGCTALHIAACHGHAEIATLLLAHGADVNKTSIYGRTALHFAVKKGHTAVAALLLKNGKVDIPTQRGCTALHIAAWQGHRGIVTLLLAHGAEADKTNNNGKAALHFAAKKGHIAVVTLLLESGNIDIPTKNGLTALHIATCHGHADIVNELLAHGAEVDKIDNKNGTALHYAAECGYENIAALLLAHGADVNKLGDANWTPLHGAAEYGYENIVALFLKHGAEVNRTNGDGWTALHGAAYYGDKETVTLLLEHGANINNVDKDGWTALHWAMQNGHKKVVEIFLYFSLNKKILRAKTPQAVMFSLCEQSVKSFQFETIQGLLQNGVTLSPVIIDTVVQAFKKVYKILSEKQNSSFMQKLLRQNHSLFRSLEDQYLIACRHDSPPLRRKFDERFGLKLR